MRVARIAVAVVLLASHAWAGDEFLNPTLRGGSGYASSDPKYRVVGIEDVGTRHIVFVVADASAVKQKTINRIVADIQGRNLGFTEIWFYQAVRDEGFAIYDHLAAYYPDENKIHYGVAAGRLYGGWAYGPRQ